MGLDFGGSLFPQQGLLQEDGIIGQRWQQEGKILYNKVYTINADNAITTVGTGLILYVSCMTITANDAGAGTWDLEDDNGGTTIFKYLESSTAGTTEQLFFDPPLAFDIAIYVNELTASNSQVTFTGWYEDE